MSDLGVREPPMSEAAGWSPLRTLGRMALLVATAVTYLFSVWYAYTIGVRTGSERVAPLIHAERTPAKVKPADPGGVKVPHQGSTVYDPLEGAKKRDKTDQAAKDDKADKDKSSTAKPATPQVASLPPASRTKVKPTPKPRRQARKKPASRVGGLQRSPTLDRIGPYRVQLAAYKTAEAASAAWKRISAQHRDLFGPLDVIIEKVYLGGKKGAVYRLQASPFKTREAADAFCAKLSKRKVNCLSIKA